MERPLDEETRKQEEENGKQQQAAMGLQPARTRSGKVVKTKAGTVDEANLGSAASRETGRSRFLDYHR
ncbi:hypothetical protein HPB48_021972 [Haemaphysalis longicornis]|uniref:Uncharacterized protein n=1 Tax=Haemaphysalis longicornis TaxID=44386 RepID=A0A9J6FZR8_HAELO|nr:hypothetical protein HPB48_021972 [Haemaphysalis longicornis]